MQIERDRAAGLPPLLRPLHTDAVAAPHAWQPWPRGRPAWITSALPPATAATPTSAALAAATLIAAPLASSATATATTRAATAATTATVATALTAPLQRRGG